MNNLEIVKSESFGKMECNFYKNENGEIFVTRTQIGKALEYANPNDAIRILHNRNKERLDKFSISFKLNGVETIFYNAKGIYEICRYSSQPKANDFYDWVYDVLETIRKYGMYATDELLDNPDFAIKILEQLKIEREQKNTLQIAYEEMKPKALFAEAVETAHTSILVGDMAKLLKQNGIDIGQNRLFQWLRDNEFLCSKKGDMFNMPTQKAMNLKLFEVKERTINDPNGSIRITKTPKVTGKGQIYFINKFIQES